VRAVSALVLAAGCAIAHVPAGESPAAARMHTIVIENVQFSPATLTIHRGDRVIWVNKDLFPHSASAGSKAFDSGAIAPGASWTYTASRAGDYAYACTFHPTMKGRLIVR